MEPRTSVAPWMRRPPRRDAAARRRGRGPSRHAADGAVRRDQGRQSGLPAVLPDGRLLRAVLRRRGGGEPRARHRAHQARQASRPGHPDVRRAGRARRRISPPADRARPPRRGVRAARGSRRGEEARRQEHRAPRRRAAGDAGHAHRGFAPRRAGATTISSPSRAPSSRRTATAASRSPSSTFPPASSASPNATATACRRSLPGSSPARSSCPTRSTAMHEVAPLLRALPVTPLGRDVFDGATAERRLAAYFAVATTDAFGALSRLELTAAAACITYVERTQIGKRPPLSPPTREAAGATLAIDAATRANLELMRTQTGERRGSLIGADRPHRHRRRRAAVVAAARRPAHRPRRDRPPARRRRAVFDRRAAARATSASGSPRRPISPARWRGSWSGAAARAISPRSATGSTPRRNCGAARR